MVCFAIPHARPSAQEKHGLHHFWPAILLGLLLLYLGFCLAQAPAPTAPVRAALSLQMKDVRPQAGGPSRHR